jgi:GNAT superfamily N-acetyltransferase
MADLISVIAAEYRRYKALADAAFAQLEDPELSQPGPNGGNSIAVLVWHVAGNLASRFTDFRTSDGEKPWRHRDEEFVQRTVSREELLEKWESGWRALFSALEGLTDDDLKATVTVRGEPLGIDQALMRSVAHTAYHVGQMLYLAKAIKGIGWKYLSIPPGGSEAYNQAPMFERASAHAAALESGAWTTDAVEVADVPVTSSEARALMEELDAELRQRYPGGPPPHGLRPRDAADANTVFVVARVREQAAACGASRRLDESAVEIKRMYVRPSHRGRGLARRILAELESRARAAGAARLVLETGVRQPEAIALYRSEGFTRIEPFGEYIGDALSRCFEKRL